jgi:hypothetical protein
MIRAYDRTREWVKLVSRAKVFLSAFRGLPQGKSEKALRYSVT